MRHSLTDIAEAGGPRLATLSQWGRRSTDPMPVHRDGPRVMADAEEVRAWATSATWMRRPARDKLLAALRALEAGETIREPGAAPAAPPAPPGLDDHALRRSSLERLDPTIPGDQRRALTELLTDIRASLRGPMPNSTRAQMLTAAARVLQQGETVRSGALTTAIKMRRLVSLEDADQFALDLSGAVARALDGIPGRISGLMAGRGMNVEEAASVAIAEARDSIADAIEARVSNLSPEEEDG